MRKEERGVGKGKASHWGKRVGTYKVETSERTGGEMGMREGWRVLMVGVW